MMPSVRWILSVGLLAQISLQAHGGGFTLSGATVTLASPASISIEGDVLLSHGSLIANGAALFVTGDWTRTNGSFTFGTSTVTFQGLSTSTSTLSGSTTFYSLRSVIAGKELTLQAGSTQTVSGSLLLTGTSGNLIRINSSVSGSPAYLINSGTNTVSFVRAQDNHAFGGKAIRAGAGSTDGGNTRNWSFGEPAPTAPLLSAVYVSSITAAWGAVPSITGYQLDASTASTFTGILFSSVTVSSAATTLTIGTASPLAAHTTYFLRIGALYNGTTTYATLNSTRTLAGGPPGSPDLTASGVTSLRAAWSAVPLTTGYEVSASTASDFTGVLFSSVTTSTSVVSLRVGIAPALTSNTTYFIRVGALYNGATTHASTVLSTSTLTSAISDAHFTNVSVSSITVAWNPLASATRYELEASTSSDFIPLVGSSITTNLSLSTLTITGLPGNTLYFFRVGGVNWNGLPNFGTVGSATAGVGASPVNPFLSEVHITSITVVWGAIAGAAGYVVNASTDSDFTGALFSTTTPSAQATSLTIGAASPLTANTTYYLRAGALYNGTTSFTPTLPASTATLTHFLTGAQIAQVFSTSVTVQWNALSSAQSYQLEASTSSDFNGTLYSSSSNILQSSLNLTGLTAGTTYFFRAGGTNWNSVSNFVDLGSRRMSAGPAPLNPALASVLVTSITVTWGPVSADNGYSLEASTASNFTGVVFSSVTTDPNAGALRMDGLQPNITYFLRVASLWNGTPHYALTTPASTTTLAVMTTGTPQRPAQVMGAFAGLGGGFVISWREVTHNTQGDPTSMGYYVIERSTDLFGTYLPVAQIAASTFSYTESTNGQTQYYRIRAADINNNLSSPSDVTDSSPQLNRHITAPNDPLTRITIPANINMELLSENNTQGDLAVQLTRRSQDESGDVLASYQITVSKVSNDEEIPFFAFSQPHMALHVNYPGSLAGSPQAGARVISASTLGALYWWNGSSWVALHSAVPLSSLPFSANVRNAGLYQIRLAQASAQFRLLPGSPYPRLLTPNRVNENRRLFFFFDNPSNAPVSGTIYDIRGAKVRDLYVDALAPSSNSLVWDGRNSRGNIVPSGVYLYKLQAGGENVTGTVVVAR